MTCLAAARRPGTPVQTARRSRPDVPVNLAALDERAFLNLVVARSGTPAEPLVGRLVARFGGAAAVFAADRTELVRACDGDEAVAAEVALLREIAVRLARIDAGQRPVITSWTALVDYVRAALAHERREQFRALYLDKRNLLLRDELAAWGTVDHAPVYPREVIRRALELSASALILVHNHPSGDPTPSRADIEMTRKIVDAGRVFDIPVHDHLVVARGGTASFKKLGLI